MHRALLWERGSTLGFSLFRRLCFLFMPTQQAVSAHSFLPVQHLWHLTVLPESPPLYWATAHFLPHHMLWEGKDNIVPQHWCYCAGCEVNGISFSFFFFPARHCVTWQEQHWLRQVSPTEILGIFNTCAEESPKVPPPRQSPSQIWESSKDILLHPLKWCQETLVGSRSWIRGSSWGIEIGPRNLHSQVALWQWLCHRSPGTAPVGSLPTSLGLYSSVNGGSTLTPTPMECLPFCVQKRSPCGVLALETCSCQGQSMCLTGNPDLELGSGFSPNPMFFLWLHNHIVLVARKLSFTEHWIEWLHYDNIPRRCQENSIVPKWQSGPLSQWVCHNTQVSFQISLTGCWDTDLLLHLQDFPPGLWLREAFHTLRFLYL